MNDDDSWFSSPERSPISEADVAAFKAEARELNLSRTAGRAGFYLRKPGPGAPGPGPTGVPGDVVYDTEPIPPAAGGTQPSGSHVRMTSRSTTAKRSNRPGRDARDRHNLYVNLAFGLVILVGLITLVGAAISTYAGAHFTEVAKVNDQSISQDTLNNRALVDAFRINSAEAQIRDQNNLGRLTDQEAQTRLSVLEQQRQSLSSSTLDRLIDATLQAQLAAKEGIAISDQQIDQRITDEATQKEQRHVWMIAVQPEVDDRRDRADRRPEGRREGRRGRRPRPDQGRQAVRGRREGVSTDAYAADRRRPRLDRRHATVDPGLPDGRCSLDANGADRRHRRRRRHVPHRPRRPRSRPPTVDPTGPTRSRTRGSHGRLPRRDPGRRRPRGADEEGRRRRDRPAVRPAPGQRDLHPERGRTRAPATGQGPPHPLLAGRQGRRTRRTRRLGRPGWAKAKAKAQATYDKLKALAGKPDS